MRCSRRWRSSNLRLTRQLAETILELDADRFAGLAHRLGRRRVVRCREHHDAIQLALDLAAHRIDLRDRLDLLAEPLDPDRGIRLVRREHLDGVAAHAERAAVEIDVVALVLELDQPTQHRVAIDRGADIDLARHRLVGAARADAVDARHRRHDDHVAPRQQRERRRVAHPIDLLVHDRVFLDERIGRRDVGLGLVVVVVADEVVDRVLGEQLLELAVELRREDLVVRHDQRRSLDLLDHVRDRVRLARAGDAEQDLRLVATLQPFGELDDRLGLIARGLVRRHQLEPRRRMFRARHGGQSSLF